MKQKLPLTLIAACTLGAYAHAPSSAEIQKTLKSNPKALDSAIAKYIENHPEAIWNAVLKYQKIQQDKQQQASLNQLKADFKQNFYSEDDGTIGSKDAPISIMVLSDRQCGYCKKAWNVLSELVEKNPSIRVSFKEMPILGVGSTQAAKFAIWAQHNGMFEKVDKALVNASNPLDLAKLKQIAKEQGISESRVDEAQNANSVTSTLERNFLLAQKIGLQGTPMLFIANKQGTKIKALHNFMDPNAIMQSAKELSK